MGMGMMLNNEAIKKKAFFNGRPFIKSAAARVVEVDDGG